MADYNGTPGDDTHTGTNDPDNIFGNGGHDTLNGEGGNDLINGGTGNDDISGGADHDRIIGLDGDDILDGDDGDDYITGGLGDDFISGGNGFDRAGYYHQDALIGGVTISLLLAGVQNTGSQGMDTLTGIEHVSGTPFGDSLTGDDGDNWLWGSAATLLDGITVSATNNDVIDGQGGDDLIVVGIGNHALNGGTHNVGWGDTLRFTENGFVTETSLTINLALQGFAQATGQGSWTLSGFENVVGGEADDNLVGDNNDNVLAGDSGADQLFGQGGNDTLLGDGYIDVDTHDTGLSGPITAYTGGDGDDTHPDGNDLLNGGAGNDLLAGGGGHDRLIGGFGNDEIHGGDGDDDLRGSNTSGTPVGGGDDILNGDAGWDRAGYYHTNQAAGGVAVSLLLQGAAQNTGSQGMDTLNGIEHLSGTPYADTLTGDGGDNWLWGSPATLADGVTVSPDNNDTLNGEGGNDLLVAGIGNHNLNGGDGIDTVRFTENGNPENALLLQLEVEGAPQATGNGSWTLTGIENVSGGQQADTIYGDDEANILAGEGGNDTLLGGDGDDILLGDGMINADTHDTGGSGPIVTVNDISEGDEDAGHDHMDGGAGVDTMRGGRGDDNYVIDDVGDAAIENADEGTDTIHTTLASYTLIANIENLVGDLDSGQTLTGHGGDNSLEAGDGADTLNGLGGNDYLNGGFGVDTLVGGLGNDLYVDWDGLDTISEAAGQGVDEVQTRAVSYTLTAANVENLTGVLHLGQELTGNALNNVIRGGLGNDELNGEQGNDTLIGEGGDDEMSGGEGDDVYFVFQAGDVVNENPGEGTDEVRTVLASYTLGANIENLTGGTPDGQRLEGNALNNVILANAGDDQLFGHDGDDHLDPRAPGDEMYGGLGNDTFVVYSAFDTVVEAAGEGTDKVLSSVTLTLASEVENLTLTGADAIDGTGNALVNALIGNAAANRLDGAAGADLMTGGGGGDVFIADNVNDKAFESAGGGTDRVESSVSFILGSNVENLVLTGAAAINATGNTLANSLTGNDAANVLSGGGDADLMTGGLGNDLYVVENAGDQIVELAGGGIDTVLSSISFGLAAEVDNLTLTGLGANQAVGNGLDNFLTGNAAANLLDGGAGHDTLNGGAAADTMKGGVGNDLYIVDNAGDAVVEAAGAAAGIDRVQSSITHTLAANVENLLLTGAAAINGTGNVLGNVITGNSAANSLSGLDGNDTLDGWGGADAMAGGTGNDTYFVDHAGDVVTEAAAAGIDTVRSSIGYTLTAEVEHLVLTGRNPINGTGNGLNNNITGNAAANFIDGGAGADTMTGDLGNDSYVVDHTSDRVIEAAGGGVDSVRSSVTFTLALEVENLTLTGAAAINGTGNTLANTLIGNDAANTLNGGSGADKMVGGLGNDIYAVDNVGDVVTEAAGAGTDTVQSAITYTLGANLENLTLTGAAAINGTGNSVANTLFGNTAANRLDGGSGNDVMVGGLGNDIFVVDNAGDVISEAAGAGTDRVESSINYTLTVNVENLVLTGVLAINGTGNALANSLTGNEAGNILNGAGGADAMVGGLGHDVYIVDNVGDGVFETALGGIDRVESSISYTLGTNLEDLKLTGGAGINGTGNSLNNNILGNSGANILNGGVGGDNMQGGLNNDIYIVDNVGDIVIEAAGAGIDSVQSSVSHTLTANVENLTLTGAAGGTGTGNALANVITGNGAGNVVSGLDGNDTIDAGGGNDRVYGGLGNDNLKGNTGLDFFFFDTALSAAANFDKILDFVVADDTIFLNRAVFGGIAANGTLAAAAFVNGPSAADASDRIVYHSASGKIYYDSDGIGGAAQILFAQVTAGTALTNFDFSAYI